MNYDYDYEFNSPIPHLNLADRSPKKKSTIVMC